jgi:hypothetical protein
MGSRNWRAWQAARILKGVDEGVYIPEDAFWLLSLVTFVQAVQGTPHVGVVLDSRSADLGQFVYTITEAFGPVGLMHDWETDDFVIYVWRPNKWSAWHSVYRNNRVRDVLKRGRVALQATAAIEGAQHV